MKRVTFILFMLLALCGIGFSQEETLGTLLSPNVPIESIPKELALPDKVLPYLRTEFNNSIGKQASFDVQFKIVLLITKITNVPTKKYDLLEEIIMWEVKNASKTEQKTIAVSPDARVLAIDELSKNKDNKYIDVLLTVVERDTSVQPRIAAARALSRIGDRNTVPKLVELLKNQYGASRAKFKEDDPRRFDDDRVAEAIIITLGDIGDPRAFPVLLQTVMNPDKHRDETVKAAWEAMKKLQW
ncbi:MAG: HEAT repeat domain-containing protein [Brevinematia bacterium]